MTDTPRSAPSSALPSQPTGSSSRIRPLLKRVLGPLLLLGLVLLLVLLAGIAWIASHFNPETQSRQLADQVRMRTGYTLTSTAPPKLIFAPRLGLSWGSLTLESPADAERETPARRVASVQRLNLTLDALALLRGQTQVRRLQLEGLSLWPAPDRRYAVPSLDLSLTPVQAAATAGSPAVPDATDTAGANPNPVPPLTHEVDLQATVLDSAGQTLPLKLQGQVGFEASMAEGQTSSASVPHAFRVVLQGAFDQTTVALDATRAGTPPVLRFDLALGTLDLDRYRAQPLAQPVIQTAALSTGVDAGLDAALASARVVSDTPAMAGPFATADTTSALRWVHELGLDTLDAQGALRVASLKFMNVQLAHLRLQAQTRDIQLPESQGQKRRRIELNPMTASLYGGGVHGSLRINLDGDAPVPPRTAPRATYVAAKLDLRGVQVGPLLRDALGVDWLEGRGNVALDLRSNGTTPETFKRQLNGTVGLQLQDGTIGLNVADALRAGLGRIGKMTAPRASTAPSPAATPTPPAEQPSRWRTPFDRLRASFQIDNGVARNQDLNLQAPSLRINGAGMAWLAEARLDYTLRVTIAPTALQGTVPGPGRASDLQTLQGLTVPVQLRGPYDDIQWRIAYADIAPTPQLRNKLKGWVQDSLDALRGLRPADRP